MNQNNDYRKQLEAIKPEENESPKAVKASLFRSRMASAPMMLAATESNDEIDTSTFIIHDRTIEVPQIADGMVAGDCNSTIITLQLSRYFDGVDLSTKRLQVAYENTMRESGYSSTIAMTTVGETLLVDWTIPSEPTKYQGKMRFALRFSETDTENGTVYVWQTKPAELNVEESIKVWYNATPPDYSFEESFVDKYDNSVVYDQMHDTNAPIMINNREITMSNIRDITVSKDTKSQIITFKINRYFKGVDLSKKTISIPFVNAIGSGDRSSAINMEVTETELSFGWLLDGKVTYEAGQVTFAIEFLGYDEKGNFYVWKTKPASFVVEDGLFVDSYIALPEPSWLQKWTVESDQVLKDTKAYSDSAKDSKESASMSATNALASETKAKNSENAAKSSETNAKSSETNAAASAVAAKASENAAKASETAAKDSETAAKSSEDAAKLSETAAALSASSAKDSEDAAKTSETNAKASEVAAKKSETNAKASEDAAKLSETNALTSETSAEESKTAAANSATNAATSAANALTSENAAKSSETNAALSRTASKASQEAALASQNAAKSSEDNAKLSETAAKAAKDSALASEQAAKTSETNAKKSETSAATSDTNASSSASEAATSALEAKTSEENAKASETASDSSAAAALASQNAAKISEDNAKGSEIAAKSSETAAQSSEASAENSKTAAALSESSASTSATTASTSAANAKTSETNSAASATSAKSSEQNAAASEGKAKTSETNAKASEANAAASALAAKTAEQNAKASETAAKTSEGNAASSAQDALESKNAAQASETSASTSATTATTKAQEASESAASALVQANRAKSEADRASAIANNLGWFSTPEALRTAHATGEDGWIAIIGTTDSIWTWDSDSSAWVDTQNKGTGDYATMLNKPQVNGVTLEGNKSLADLGVQPEGDYATGSELSNGLAGKVDKITGKGLSSEDYTTSEKTKLAGLSNYDDSAIKVLLNNKVDKVSGKSLSTNDYTTAEKTKLSGLSNYDDTTIKASITAIETKNIAQDNEIAKKVDKITGKGLSTNDYTTAEKQKLASLSNYDDTGVKASIAGKTDKPSSAVDGHLAALDASGNLKDSGKKTADFATQSQLPTKTSQLQNDSNFAVDSHLVRYDPLGEEIAPLEPSVNDYVLPAASPSTLGGVKIGANFTIAADGTLSIDISALAAALQTALDARYLKLSGGTMTGDIVMGG